jgi:hypothetical protein
MTSTTEGRNTKRRNPDRVSLLVDTGVTVLAGTMVAVLTATGEAVAGGAASSGNVIGVAETTVTGDGVERVDARFGCFQFANSASTDLIAAGDIGGIAYVVDNQTVAKTDNGGARKIAGVIVDVDAAGVWVDIRPGAVGPQGPAGA